MQQEHRPNAAPFAGSDPTRKEKLLQACCNCQGKGFIDSFGFWIGFLGFCFWNGFIEELVAKFQNIGPNLRDASGVRKCYHKSSRCHGMLKVLVSKFWDIGHTFPPTTMVQWMAWLQKGYKYIWYMYCGYTYIKMSYIYIYHIMWHDVISVRRFYLQSVDVSFTVPPSMVLPSPEVARRQLPRRRL